ncbi:MAG TPA: PPC domain-containing protein, partial [Gemmatimonadales bacterium]|nr:PPC domain-containing protein [Gemmatimonadales bacterium]
MTKIVLLAGMLSIGAAPFIGAAPLIAQTIQEREPNDSPATADTVTRGSTVQATIAPYNQATGYRDVDYYLLTAKAGDTIFVDIDANEFGTHMNMGLVLYAADGTTMLAYNNDWDGVDPHIEYVATATGPYYVAAGTSLETTPWGNPAPYTIHFYQVKCPTDLDPEPNDTAATATGATLGQTIHGRSCPAGDVDFYKFQLDPGTVEFNFAMDPHERPTFGSAGEIIGWITLYGPDGRTQLATTGGHGDADHSPSRIEYTVRTRGTYYLSAHMWPGGIRYTYSISSRLMSGPVAGDPITVRAEIGNGYWHDDGAVVDRNGDILVSDGGQG